MEASTPNVVPSKRANMGRRQINHEQTMARFAKGTLDRIKAVLGEREKQADFIREAVEAALTRREDATLRNPNPPMPEHPLDPYVALEAIRTFTKIALTNEEPTAQTHEQILREILNVCEQAMPKKGKGKRGERPVGEREG